MNETRLWHKPGQRVSPVAGILNVCVVCAVTPVKLRGADSARASAIASALIRFRQTCLRPLIVLFQSSTPSSHMPQRLSAAYHLVPHVSRRPLVSAEAV